MITDYKHVLFSLFESIGITPLKATYKNVLSKLTIDQSYEPELLKGHLSFKSNHPKEIQENAVTYIPSSQYTCIFACNSRQIRQLAYLAVIGTTLCFMADWDEEVEKVERRLAEEERLQKATDEERI